MRRESCMQKGLPQRFTLFMCSMRGNRSCLSCMSSWLQMGRLNFHTSRLSCQPQVYCIQANRQSFCSGEGDEWIVSVTVISRIIGCPSSIEAAWLLGNLARCDNSSRCIAVSIRRRDWPRTNTSCVAKTRRRRCSFCPVSSSAYAN